MDIIVALHGKGDTVSATNWGNCPRCRREVQESVERARGAAEEVYGKVPLADYEQLRAEADRDPDLQSETLREDYEVWIGNDGVFHVSYAASCDRCAFSHQFEHTEPTVEVPSQKDRKATDG